MKVLECNFVRNASGGWHVKVVFDKLLISDREREITAHGRRVSRLTSRLNASQGVSLVGSTATILNCKEMPDQLVKVFEGPYEWKGTHKFYAADNKIIMSGSLPFGTGDMLHIDDMEQVKTVGWYEHNQESLEIKLHAGANHSRVVRLINKWMNL